MAATLKGVIGFIILSGRTTLYWIGIFGMNSCFKMRAVTIAATTALSLTMSVGVLADENDVSAYLNSAAEEVSLQDFSDVSEKLYLYYKTVAENYQKAGLNVPEDIIQGLKTYGNIDISAISGAAEETLTSAANGSTNTTSGESVTFIKSEDGSELMYRVDPLTGEAGDIYEGWYTDSEGNKFFYEKGKAASGWIIDDGKFYYLETSTGVLAVSKQVGNFYVGEDGAALIDSTAPDGTKLAYNGSRMISKNPVEKLDDKVYIYRELLVKNPDLYAEFTVRSSGGYQIMPESANGFRWYTYATMKLYERKEDGSMGKKVYEGDGCFSSNAVIEYEDENGKIATMKPSDIIGSGHEIWIADHLHIDPAGFITYSAIK